MSRRDGKRWVDPREIEVRRIGIGALPVVNAVLSRLGFDELVRSFRLRAAGAPRSSRRG